MTETLAGAHQRQAGRQPEQQFDVVALGEALVEFNQTGTDTYTRGFGGDTSNCAIAARRQGASVAYLSAIGADAFGDDLLALWQREGVDTSGVLRHDMATTGVYFVAHDESGHRFSYLRAGSAASRMRPDELSVNVLHCARYLHLSAISQAISDSACDTCFVAIATARDHGTAIAYDTNLRKNLWALPRARAVIVETLRQVDIALPGLDDAALVFGLSEPQVLLDQVLALGPKTVALSMGADGVWLATPNQREWLPAHNVAAIDATGAGDTFDGAFLARLAAGDDVLDAGRYANAAAALSTTGYGAVAPIPIPTAVWALLHNE